MTSRKIRIISLVVLSVALLAILGTVISYMFKQTGYWQGNFSPAQVDCAVEEKFEDNVKSSIQVKNIGNIDAYLRVRLVTYWVDGSGNIVSKPSRAIEFECSDKWIKGSNDTYYYKEPVSPEASTENLFKSDTTLVLIEQDGCYQVVEVFAEAIQSKPTKAVTSSWGVTLDSNGNIQ